MAVFSATPSSTETIQRFSPQQQGLQNQAIQQLMAMLQGGGGGLQPILNQARSQFATETVPGLAERFTSVGGGQRSSAFQGALGSAAGGLEESLASLQSQHQLGQQNLLGGLAMQPSFEQLYIPRSPGAVESSLPKVFEALTYILPLILGIGGSAAGGPVGGSIGTGAGTALSALIQRLASRSRGQ